MSIFVKSGKRDVTSEEAQNIFIHFSEFCRNVMMNATADGHYFSDNGYGFNFSAKPIELGKPTFEISVQDYSIQKAKIAHARHHPAFPCEAVLTLLSIDPSKDSPTVHADFNPLFWKRSFENFTGIVLTVTPI